MRLKTVPALTGLTWVRAGFRVFVRQPLVFGALFGLTGFGALMLAQLPLVGPVLALALMPAATLAFMLATRAVLDERTESAVFATIDTLSRHLQGAGGGPRA